MLTVGSLFAGIGGFDLGLERAGMRTLWFCEQDPFCQRVLARHWPGIPVHDDVRALVADSTGGRLVDSRGDDGEHAATGRRRTADEDGITVEGDPLRPLPVQVPPVDVLCGGFPCQDLSYAGAGAGLAGRRSGLWGEYARLVGELRPRYVLVENVAALLGRGLGVVLGDLAALGYDAEWDCIPASAVGAPHQRDRVWLVAYPDGSGRVEGQRDVHARQSDLAWSGPHPDAHGTGWSIVAEHDSGAHELGGRPPGRHADGLRDQVADADSIGRDGRPRQLRPGGRGEPADGGGEQAGAGAASWWAVEPDVGRVAHGIPARVDRLRSLGNALVPQIAEWIGRRIIDWEAA